MVVDAPKNPGSGRPGKKWWWHTISILLTFAGSSFVLQAIGRLPHEVQIAGIVLGIGLLLFATRPLLAVIVITFHREFGVLRSIAIVGFITAGIAAFLPWWRVSGPGLEPYEIWGDEYRTFNQVFIFAGCAGGLTAAIGRKALWVSLTCGIAATALAWSILQNPERPQTFLTIVRPATELEFEPLYGLYLLLGSSVAALAAGLLALLVWLFTPPPEPTTFPRMKEQFPRL